MEREKKEQGDVKKKKKLHLLKGVYGKKKKGVNANNSARNGKY